MDDQKLDKILKNIDAPQADENAKKRALNLAMAEFDTHQKQKSEKKSKKIQGFDFLHRLIFMQTDKTDKERKDPMAEKSRKNFIYGGMATAMAIVIVIVASVGLYQAPQFGLTDSQLVTGNLTSTTAQRKEDISDTYRQALETRNAQDFETASQTQKSFVPLESKTVSKKTKPSSLAEHQALSLGNRPQRIAEEISTLNRTRAVTELYDEVDSIALPAVKEQQLTVMVSPDEIQPTYYKDKGRDKFQDFVENPFEAVSAEPVSTFSVDVDTASYSFMRRQLNNGVLPQKDAIRIEELINYFDYNYAVPEDRSAPFKPTVAITDSPWNNGKKLMHIGIKGYELQGEQPNSNIVFLLDVSGSMNSPDKLPLVKNSMKMLLNSLKPDDTVSIAVYAGAAGTVLEPTKASEKAKIIAAFDRLSAGGSTAGAAGINLAYQLAEQNFDENAVNRVILATDGDFNVGIHNREELKDFVERKREKGVFLSVLGFGQGNYNDDLMQALAQNGNGVAAYIDNLNEARKVLVEEATSSLFPIAKDVKIQIEFNPALVSEYRLVGYETRALNREDFNNDKVDSGDIGAGHTVTAIYEYTLAGAQQMVDPLRYGTTSNNAEKEGKPYFDKESEIAFLKLRYKLPKEDTSKLITTPVNACGEYDFSCNLYEVVAGSTLEQKQIDTNFATAVASFAQILKGGKYTGQMSYDDVITLAQSSKGQDLFGYRTEFIQLVRLAKTAAAMTP